MQSAQNAGQFVILFGGTFDPPHVGHLTMAQLALEQTQADAVWLLPAPVPPHKETQSLPYPTRVELTAAMVADYPKLSVCTAEAELATPSYTVDTVAALHRRCPDTRFVFLIGTDSLAQLPTWRRAAELALRIHFLVAVRSGFPFTETLAAAQKEIPQLQAMPVEMPIIDVSSSWVRHRWAAGKPVCGLVPDSVEAAYAVINK